MPFTCPPVDADGTALVKWIHYVSGACVYGDLKALSWLVQNISVGVWVFSGTYQSWLCYRTKEVSGFSEYFLLCWIVGAVLNTLGCFLTDQMTFQKLLGVYFLFSDSFLYFQYRYYISRPHLAVEVVQRENQVLSNKTFEGEMTVERTQELPQSALPPSSSLTPGILLGLTLAPTGAKGAPIPTNTVASAASSLASKSIPLLASWSALGYFIGNTASWSSNTLYVVSRIPQISRNYERKSTEGVSPALFIAVLVGNAAYTLAVATEWQAVTDPVEKAKFVVAEMPFIVGGIATTLMDLIIFAQLYLYRNNGIAYEIVEGVEPAGTETGEVAQPGETTKLIVSRDTVMYST